jgi:hypothetical protein
VNVGLVPIVEVDPNVNLTLTSRNPPDRAKFPLVEALPIVKFVHVGVYVWIGSYMMIQPVPSWMKTRSVSVA